MDYSYADRECARASAFERIELLKREPSLDVHAFDKSRAMQEVGARKGKTLTQIPSLVTPE